MWDGIWVVPSTTVGPRPLPHTKCRQSFRDLGVAARFPSFPCLYFVHIPRLLATRAYVAKLISAMATTMAIAGAASSQALLAVSCSKLPGSLRHLHSAVALPPLRLLSTAATPQRLIYVRATSQVDTTSASSSKATVPDTEISITKVHDETLPCICYLFVC